MMPRDRDRDRYPDGGMPRRPPPQGSGRRKPFSPNESAGKTLDRIVELVGQCPEEIILDMTHGAGYTGMAIAPNVKHVVVCDETTNRQGEAISTLMERSITNVSTVVTEFGILPFANGTFKTIVCRATSSRFQDIRQCIRELARVTAKGGRVIIVDTVVPEDREVDAFLNQLEKNQNPAHVRHYNTKEWKVLFADAGLKVQVIEEDVYEHDKGEPLAIWLDRQGSTAQTIRQITGMLVSANSKIKEAVNLKVEAGEITLNPRKVVLVGGK